MRFYPPYLGHDDDDDDDEPVYESNIYHVIFGLAIAFAFVYVKKWYENRSKNPTPIEADYQIQALDPYLFQINNLTWQASNLNAFTEGSYCYHDTQRYCHDHGKLYTWAAARKACEDLGDGWRLPTRREWSELMTFMGDSYASKVSFSGFRSQGQFRNLNTTGVYWTSSEADGGKAWSFAFSKDGVVIGKEDQGNGFSCRCVQEKEAPQ